MEKLEEFIRKEYKPEDGAKTSMFSEGNYDDVFSDGFDRGYACALQNIAALVGVLVPPLKEQELDY